MCTITLTGLFLCKILNKKQKKMPAYNKRFREIGGKVILRLRSVTITRISVCPITFCDSRNYVQSSTPTSPSRRDGGASGQKK